MRSFAFLPAGSAEEAVELLGRYGEEAHLLAGGTSLVLMLQQGLIEPGVVVGLRSAAGLEGVRRGGEGRIEIGAMTTLRQLECDPLVCADLPWLSAVVGRVATVRVRNQATIGGNLAHADPAQDPPPILLTLDGEVEAMGPMGLRTIPIDRFFVDVFETALTPGEILTRLIVPLPPSSARFATIKFLPRTVEDFATVSVAVRIDQGADRRIEDVRIAVGAVAPIPLRVVAAEALLRGQVPDAALVSAAAELVRDAVDPFGDVRGSADYKREMARVWTARALRQALGQREAT